MSEKSKGDTSRIVNNPLLSASVTGLTFDDFPSAPLLLPAAPPIERSPPPVLDLNSDTKGRHQPVACWISLFLVVMKSCYKDYNYP
ncbi:unnamed protein product [Hermetia illucens]|uniref:Uncharacterized protein n=1 Tax=Hermetia illucens TaxID=343691 RepID=A0A7R8V1C7_HERIL|nr:unnamed protein product [Hermetia illucens]